MARPRTRDFDLEPGWYRKNGRVYFTPTTKGEREARRQRAYSLPDGELVYFIRAKGGAVKIGYTSSRKGLEDRLASLRVGSAAELTLLGAVAGSRADEARAHEAMRLYRRSGEWFGPARAVTAYARQAIIDGKIAENRKSC